MADICTIVRIKTGICGRCGETFAEGYHLEPDSRNPMSKFIWKTDSCQACLDLYQDMRVKMGLNRTEITDGPAQSSTR